MRQPGSLCVEKIVWVGFKLSATLYRLDLNWLPCSDIILDNSSRDKIAMGQEPPCYSGNSEDIIISELKAICW